MLGKHSTTELLSYISALAFSFFFLKRIIPQKCKRRDKNKHHGNPENHQRLL
jgi:hypothetical protein